MLPSTFKYTDEYAETLYYFKHTLKEPELVIRRDFEAEISIFDRLDEFENLTIFKLVICGSIHNINKRVKILKNYHQLQILIIKIGVDTFFESIKNIR